MTNEDAINMLYGIRADNLNLDDAYTKDKYDALTMAIKALEQESEIDLNKIRAEIENIEISGMVDANTMYARSAGQIKNIVIEIIDKYREQKPKTDTWSIKDVAKAFEKHGLIEQEPNEPVGNSDKLDCISRDMLLEKMADYVSSGYADSVEDFEEYSKIICQLPSVQQEPKMGHWVENEKQIHVEKIYHCSECGFEAWGECERTNYCGGCGARMSEVSE